MPCPTLEPSFEGTATVSVTTSPWFTENDEGENEPCRAVMLMVTALGPMASGWGITGPWLDMARIIIRRCSRCSACSPAASGTAANASANTSPPIFRMITRRLPFRDCLQLDDDVAAVEHGQNPEPERDEAEAPQQGGEFLREKRLEPQH